MDKTTRRIHPYVLNKDFGGSGIEHNDSKVGWNFLFLHRNSSRETRCMEYINIIKINNRSMEHININKINNKCLLHKLNQQLFNNLPNINNFIRVNIASLNKSSLKEIADVINERLNIFSKAFKYFQ